jgi:hypothetical protein
MRYFGVLFCAACLFGQEYARPGILRGELAGIEKTGTAGNLDVRTRSADVLRCTFDAHTYFERDHQRIGTAALYRGDPLEIIADRKADQCYARTVRVVKADAAAGSSRYLTRARSLTSALDHIMPRGNLTFAGVILRMSDSILVLRTRTESEKVVRLRDDTRFLDSGLPSDASALCVNKRVFVRAGQNLDNQVEAYQVIWGEIAGPSPGSQF